MLEKRQYNPIKQKVRVSKEKVTPGNFVLYTQKACALWAFPISQGGNPGARKMAEEAGRVATSGS